MLNTIKLKFGDSTNQNLSFSVQPINIIVGPNNAGKSLFLKEVLDYLGSREPREQQRSLIIEEISLEKISDGNLHEILNSRRRDKHNYEHVTIFDPNGHASDSIQEAEFINAYNNFPTENEYYNRFIIRFFGGQSILLLNGQTRLSSLSWKNFSTIPDQNNENNPVNKIINDDNVYNKLQNYIYDAFKAYPEISINGAQARIVLSESKIPEDLRLSIKPEATEFLSDSQSEENTSDGRKAYTGIISEIISGNPDTILLDEPEAFLHPPLARKLGNVLSTTAIEESKQLFISTHSSDFIMGCIESRVPINIIRLTYDEGKATSKLLDSDSLAKMMKNPLLRSTNVLDGIFHKNVIVTESDSDRVFYQEINHRLKDFKPEWYIEDCLFLNAQNKQTVGWITKQLRAIGIPTVSILDFDLVKDGGNVFTRYLSSVNIPETFHSSISDKKTKIKEPFPKKDDGSYANNSEIKTEGVKYLENNKIDLYHLALSFLQDLNDYGLFVVPNGELESWLTHLNVTGHGNSWLTKMFDTMGDNPESDAYIKPTEDDVWLFFKQIKEWLDNPDKLGM